jgi:ATP-dependent protease ClpP protease subunit
MKPWYKITAKKDKAEIMIYEQIGQSFWDDSGVSAKKFVSDLNALDVGAIDLFVNSPGGNVFEGNSIYNALVRHKAKISATIDGVAASIASVIVMAADKIRMPKNSLMMIHDPSALVMGTAEDMQKMIEALSRIKTGLISAYMTHTTKTEKEVDEMMQAETWMTAKEAVDMGFATEMIEPVKMAASFEAFKYFNNVPESLTVSGKTNLTKEGDSMKISLELIQNEHPEIVNAILAGVDLDYIRANLPDIVNQFETEGKAQGAEAERNRIQAIREQSMPGHDALIEQMMFDGKTTGEQAAVKILQAEKKHREIMAANIEKDAPDIIEQPSTDNVDEVIVKNMPVDKRCEAQWKKDQDLQNEFGGDFLAYLAYEKALDAGKVKVLGA